MTNAQRPNQVLNEEIKNPHRFMTLTYVVSLSIIAILSLAVHFMLNSVIDEQSSSAGLINVSGQQRMLSQRSGLFTLEYILTNDKNAKEQALAALQKMNRNHALLTSEHFNAVNEGRPSPMSSTLQALYFSEPNNVEEKLSVYTSLLQQTVNERENASNGSPSQNVERLLDIAKKDLLDAFNTVVLQYETESQQRVNKLKSIQNVVLFIIILTILAEALFIFRPMVRKIAFYASRLEYETRHDALSGVFNKRAFNDFISNLFAQAKRYNQDLSLLVFDIDFFKKVNDTYGHDVGDHAIQHLAQHVNENCRDCDILARVGGEEFALILPSTTGKQALAVAEKLRNIVEKTPLVINETEISITVSIGVSEIQTGNDTSSELFIRADKALYTAKQTGRNKSVLSH